MPKRCNSYTSTIGKYLLILFLFLAGSALPANANQPQIETAFLALDSTLDDALSLDSRHYKPHQAIMLNPLTGHASAWIKIQLPEPEQRFYRLTMPFSLRTQLDVYAYRKDGSQSTYSLGAHGADTKYHSSALGYQIQLDSSLLDFAQPLYLRAKTSIFLNQEFDFLSEAEFQSIDQQITKLHQGMVLICIVCICAYIILLLRFPTALVGASLALLISLLFFILSSISLALITSINFQSPTLHVIALFDMPLMFFLVAMSLRRLALTSFIAPIIDKALYSAQIITLAAAISTLALDHDTADNVAFLSVVVNLGILTFSVFALILTKAKYKCARTAIFIFGTPILGSLIYIGPAYFGLMPASSGYMALPIATIGMAIGLLILVPRIDSGQLQRENREIIDSIEFKRPFVPLAVRYTIIILSFGLMFIVAATVLMSALESRQTEQQYTETAEDQFNDLRESFRNTLSYPQDDTEALDLVVTSGLFAGIQLSTTGRDGPVIYQQTATTPDRTHTSYFNVSSGDKSGVAKLTLDISRNTEIEHTRYINRLILNLTLAAAVSVFSVSIFRILVTKHLETMAEHLGKVKLKRYNNPLKLFRDNEVQTDELDFLGDAIETMEQDLHSSYTQLAESKAYLEKEIIKRTAAYKEVLEREHRKRHLVTMGLMVAGVAHEIRNPLGTLASSITLLRANYDGPHDKVFDRIDRNIGRCNSVVEELRAIGQLNTLKLEQTSLNQWLRKLIDDYTQLHSIPIKLTTEREAFATLDQYRMEQVLIILLDNARQAISYNEVEWPDDGELAVHLELAAGNTATIKVIDNGGGIPSNIKSRIFDPLSSSKISGFGMGLTIALDIVEQHGGSLELNDLEKGISAEVTFPADLGSLQIAQSAINEQDTK